MKWKCLNAWNVLTSQCDLYSVFIVRLAYFQWNWHCHWQQHLLKWIKMTKRAVTMKNSKSDPLSDNNIRPGIHTLWFVCVSLAPKQHKKKTFEKQKEIKKHRQHFRVVVFFLLLLINNSVHTLSHHLLLDRNRKNVINVNAIYYCHIIWSTNGRQHGSWSTLYRDSIMMAVCTVWHWQKSKRVLAQSSLTMKNWTASKFSKFVVANESMNNNQCCIRINCTTTYKTIWKSLAFCHHFTIY